jgi:hypothetical protein
MNRTKRREKPPAGPPQTKDPNDALSVLNIWSHLESEQKPPGRRAEPRRKSVKARRVMMALRVTPDLHDEILRRVEATGRSITQEMEMLLEQALFTERAMSAGGGRAWQISHDVMVRLIRAVIDRERQTGKVAPIEPLYDSETYRLAMINAIEGLAANWPGFPALADIDGAINEARGRIAQKWKAESNQ